MKNFAPVNQESSKKLRVFLSCSDDWQVCYYEEKELSPRAKVLYFLDLDSTNVFTPNFYDVTNDVEYWSEIVTVDDYENILPNDIFVVIYLSPTVSEFGCYSETYWSADTAFIHKENAERYVKGLPNNEYHRFWIVPISRGGDK